MENTHNLPEFLIDPIIRAALVEDLGQVGDITSRLVIPAGAQITARIVARQSGIVSGLQIAARVFAVFDNTLQVTIKSFDGAACDQGMELLRVTGNTRSILSAERVALNFMGRLCGIASQTSEYVGQTVGTNTRVTCTRKTTPGLRLLEKQAVLHGGGLNHRFGLGDAVMIKDNHIAAAGGIKAVLQAARANVSHLTRVEIEVDTLGQLDEVLTVGGADVVLLDNMNTNDLERAVSTVAGNMITEASGNMILPRIAEVAATGVDYISVGALTHSVTNMDLGLDI